MNELVPTNAEHPDGERAPRVPSSPANPESVAARMGRALLRSRLRVHVRRLLAISAAVLVVGAGVSLYLAEVGTRSCWDESEGLRCRETSWYALTLQRRSVLETLDGVPDGPRTDWYANGGIWLTGSYSRGARVGVWQELWPSGELRFSGEYVADKLHGTESWWYANGNIEWQVHRQHGERHGQEIWWHPNGNRRRVGTYEKGERHGLFSVFHPDGTPVLLVEYAHGAHVAQASDAAEAEKEI